MGSRRISRILTLQIIYLCDLCHIAEEEATKIVFQKNSDEKAQEFTTTLTHGVLSNIQSIDSLIMKYAENWELKRMAVIDRNILRLASFELLHQIQTPVNVIIDEAVEIAKEYSTIDSGKFVNGILDKIKNERIDKETEKSEQIHESRP
ncbi:MAG: transcription antitermination factor NusB [bacterium]